LRGDIVIITARGTIKEMRFSTNEWLETALGYASYANRSGLYDNLVEFFER
jgi:hypothetical protein